MTEKEDLFNEGAAPSSGAGTGGAQGGESSPSGTEALAGAGDKAGELIGKWVGEGKKFSSVDQLVESYDNSQQFIEQLKQENADMRKELSNEEKLDQILSRIEASGSQQGSPKGEGPSGGTPPSGTGQGEASGKSIEEQISEAVQSEVTRREQQHTAEQNQNEASDKLLELAGSDRDEAKRILKKAAGDLGVSVGYLQQQAQTSPSAFYRMVSASYSAPPQGGGSGSHNPEALEAQHGALRAEGGDVQPWSYWRKKKREVSRAEFYSPEVQNKIFKSRKELGDRFFDVT